MVTLKVPTRTHKFDKGVLRPFQVEDVDHISSVLKRGRAAFNYNEMGLGKTIEAIGIADELNSKRILVLCPLSLMGNWKNEIQKWDGYTAAVSNRETYKKFTPYQDKWLGKWFVSNIQAVVNRDNYRFLTSFGFDLIIIDEAHNYRNFNTKRSVSIRDFFQSFNHYNNAIPIFTGTAIVEKRVETKILFLTGSPIINAATDMYLMLHTMDPNEFVSYAAFERDHCLIKTVWTPKGYVKKADKFKDPQYIQNIINKNGVQRTKLEVAPELPDKIITIIPMEMENKQLAIYRDIEAGLIVDLENGDDLFAPNVLAKLIRLRQLCLDPAIIKGNDDYTGNSIKTEFMDEFIENLGNEPFVAFTTFRSYLPILEKILKRHGIIYDQIHGDIPGEKRTEVVRKFQEENTQALIATIQAGGEGITLTKASKVIIIDKWWTPAAQNQAMDRLHRIGQTSSVNVYYPEVDDSIDKMMSDILAEKQSLIDSIQIKIAEGGFESLSSNEQANYQTLGGTSIQRELMHRVKARR